LNERHCIVYGLQCLPLEQLEERAVPAVIALTATSLADSGDSTLRSAITTPIEVPPVIVTSSTSRSRHDHPGKSPAEAEPEHHHHRSRTEQPENIYEFAALYLPPDS
jgi:hypothetical protein